MTGNIIIIQHNHYQASYDQIKHTSVVQQSLPQHNYMPNLFQIISICSISPVNCYTKTAGDTSVCRAHNPGDVPEDMMSTKATTLNSEQNVLKVLLLSLHLLVVVHLTQHKLPATLGVAHAHLPLALVVLLLLARRVVPVDRRQHWSCRHHCNYRRSLTEMYVNMSNKSTRGSFY